MKFCYRCQAKREYSDKWDAYYCKACNEWLEPPCTTKADDANAEQECYFKCWERPKRPLGDEEDK